MDLAKSGEDGVLTAAQKREPRHKKPRDKWNLIGRNCQEPYCRYNHVSDGRTKCPEMTKDIANMKSDTTENRLLGKGAPDDDRPCKQQDVAKEDPNDRTNKGIIESKATD